MQQVYSECKQINMWPYEQVNNTVLGQNMNAPSCYIHTLFIEDFPLCQ